MRDYLDRSAISDKMSILIKVWNDDALSIRGLTYDSSEETIAARNLLTDRWYLKNKRKLTDKELICLNSFFSTSITKDNVDIICDNGTEIMHVN